LIVLALVSLMALASGAGGSATTTGERATDVVTVACRDADLREPNGIQKRVILGVVSVPPAYVPQVVRYQHDGWAYWSKWGSPSRPGTARS
jgi:intracellular sulfur oxidation DsrE/DsrF family protein